MSVYKRKLANGEMTHHYYFEFRLNGKRYKGCTYETNKNKAIEFEKDYKTSMQELLDERASTLAARKRSLLNFRDKITREVQGDSIPLDEIWSRFVSEAPSKMKRIPNAKGWAEKEAYLKDFLCFLKNEHPSCKTMLGVSPEIAEQYIGIIKTSGRYNKTVQYKDRTYENKVTQLSASSINEYITQLKQIFRILSKPAGLLENPFQNIEKLAKKSKKRDVFDIHELEKIDKHLRGTSDSSSDLLAISGYKQINEAIFTIGINTGLRKGDISLLKWEDINFEERSINRELLKTGESVFIPMSKRLFDYLKERQKSITNEYVTPELAAMYKVNPEGITYRFKKMLEHLNIQSQREYDTRSRKVSTKDIHSLRHTFCYLHGMQGTPLVVVQSMVGHMDKKMTESYMMHQTKELKREAIKKMAGASFLPTTQTPHQEFLNQIIEKIRSCACPRTLNKIDQLLNTKRIDEDQNQNDQGNSFKM